MPASEPTVPLTTEQLNQIREQARRWSQGRPDASARLLSTVLSDPHGLEFTIGFIDGVVRPADLKVAGRNLSRLRAPKSLALPLRALVRLGGIFAPVLPGVVVPIARWALRKMVSHLILDLNTLGPHIKKLHDQGYRLNMNLLGEAVLGADEAARRLEGTKQLLARHDVDYVSIKSSSVVAQLNLWDFEAAVTRVVDQLRPLYAQAAASPTRKFINLDMEEYKDLRLTMEVFERLMGEFPGLEAGIVIQAYLPDALGAFERINDFTAKRVADGGARLKVRLVKGANLAMERVDAQLHGFPLATTGSKAESDANYKRVLDRFLRPETAVKIGVAGHNLFDVAYAQQLARQRGVEVDFEMLLGMVPPGMDIEQLLLYTPVVDPKHFDSAISYLTRRLEENASPENFMSVAFDLDQPRNFEREYGRFAESLTMLDDEVGPNRGRTLGADELATDGFFNQPDTDVSVPRADLPAPHWPDELPALDAEKALSVARAAQPGWASDLDHRRDVLLAAAEVLEQRRPELIATSARETGKPLSEADVEVSEAIDFARYYARFADQVTDGVYEGATLVPEQVVVVVPPWNFPLAIPFGGVAAALMGGASVVIKPAPESWRCAHAVVSALWQAGVPEQVLQCVSPDENEQSRELISQADRVVLTGSYETAALFASWNPDLSIHAETSGKNSIIVTPSADRDLAAADVVRSAFGHAGQKCSASSLMIQVGDDPELIKQIVDAAATMRVGLPFDGDQLVDAGTHVGPVTALTDKLRGALTQLQPGEQWLLQPRDLGDNLWTPGIKTVLPGGEFHLTEYFGPVLGIMSADNLDQAMEYQNATEYGLTAGIFSLDSDEVDTWLARIQAGNLYVNRGITGAIVRRQPFGGWKKSVYGPTVKAGGPNYVASLMNVEPDGPATGAAFLDQAARLDQQADAWFAPSDPSALPAERNILRYLPTFVTIRAGADAHVDHLQRVVAAADRARASYRVSLHPEFAARNPEVSGGVEVTCQSTGRVRLVGTDTKLSPEATVYSQPVTSNGVLERLPFLREQAISVTAHRFGNPLPDGWFPEVLSV